MWVLCILLLGRTTAAISADSTADGERVGQYVLFGIAGIIVVMLGLCLCKHGRSLGALTQVLLTLQFVRWGLVLDYSPSAFYLGVWKEMRRGFVPFGLLDYSETGLPSARFKRIGVDTSDFLTNSLAYLVFLSAAAFFLSLLKLLRRPTSKHVTVQVLQWCFLVAYFDLIVFGSLQLTELSGDSAWRVINGLASILVLLLAAAFACAVVYGTVAKPRLAKYFRLYSREFKEQEPTVVKLYYPILVITRFVLAATLGSSTSTAIILTAFVTSEGLLALYLLAFTPFQAPKASPLAFVQESSAIVVFLGPALFAGDENAVGLTLVVLLAMIPLCGILRAVLEVRYKPTQRQNADITVVLDHSPNAKVQRKEHRNRTSLEPIAEAKEEYSSRKKTVRPDDPIEGILSKFKSVDSRAPKPRAKDSPKVSAKERKKAEATVVQSIDIDQSLKKRQSSLSMYDALSASALSSLTKQ